MGDKIKIGEHWYKVLSWYPSKSEAQSVAKKYRKAGHYKNVRVIKRLADRRYARYYVCVRV